MSDLHPSGVFDDVEIIDHGFDEVGEKNSLRFWVKFQTGEGMVFGNFWLTPKAAEHTLKKIAIMWGAEAPDKPDMKSLDDGTELAGNVVQVTVEHDTWEGKTRAVVGFVNRNHAEGGPTRDENATSSASAFNALLRKTVKAAQDDDCPF
jgi:hypothetical protein